MSLRKPRHPIVVFIVGATATGKSHYALEAAQKFDGEIINGDSVQIYDSVEIGTAKPSKEEFSLVPHHLFGFVPENVKYSAGKYRTKALECIEQCSNRGKKTLFVVGGSGFYIQALAKGMYSVGDIPETLHRELEEEQKTKGLQLQYDRLMKLDPEYAQKLSPNDSYRILRALEVVIHHNRTLTDIRKEFEKSELPFQTHFLGIARRRTVLREIIRKRTQKMLAAGLVEEVESLLAKGLEDWHPLKSVGYKEVVSYLHGQLKFEDLEDAISTSTAQLAKRQSTWFRKNPRIIWMDPDHNPHGPITYLQDILTPNALG